MQVQHGREAVEMGAAPLWKREHEAACSHLGRPGSREGPEVGLGFTPPGESSVTHFLTGVLEPPQTPAAAVGQVPTHEPTHRGYFIFKP